MGEHRGERGEENELSLVRKERRGHNDLHSIKIKNGNWAEAPHWAKKERTGIEKGGGGMVTAKKGLLSVRNNQIQLKTCAAHATQPKRMKAQGGGRREGEESPQK